MCQIWITVTKYCGKEETPKKLTLYSTFLLAHSVAAALLRANSLRVCTTPQSPVTLTHLLMIATLKGGVFKGLAL